MVFMENAIVLTDAERVELNQRAPSRSGRADDARRARLLLRRITLSSAVTGH